MNLKSVITLTTERLFEQTDRRNGDALEGQFEQADDDDDHAGVGAEPADVQLQRAPVGALKSGNDALKTFLS